MRGFLNRLKQAFYFVAKSADAAREHTRVHAHPPAAARRMRSCARTCDRRRQWSNSPTCAGLKFCPGRLGAGWVLCWTRAPPSALSGGHWGMFRSFSRFKYLQDFLAVSCLRLRAGLVLGSVQTPLPHVARKRPWRQASASQAVSTTTKPSPLVQCYCQQQSAQERCCFPFHRCWQMFVKWCCEILIHKGCC